MLTDEARSRLKPLLGPIARKVKARIPLQPGDFQQMLAPCGLQQNPEALDELRKWDELLRRLQGNPTAENRQRTRDALVAGGLPMAPAWLAVDLAVASRPQPQTSSNVTSASASQQRPSQAQQSAMTCTSSVKSDPTRSPILDQSARVPSSELHPLVFLFLIPIVLAVLPFALAWRVATSKFGLAFIKCLFAAIGLFLAVAVFIPLLMLIIIGAVVVLITLLPLIIMGAMVSEASK